MEMNYKPNNMLYHRLNGLTQRPVHGGLFNNIIKHQLSTVTDKLGSHESN